MTRFQQQPTIENEEQFDALCLACRAGDLDLVDNYLTQGVNPNQMDQWDYSPLILASLCGHEEIVKLLLEKGAVVNRDTFDGARAIYGALNDRIRNILLSYDINKAVDLNQPFAAHFTGLLNSKQKFITADLVLADTIKVHEFVLRALSDWPNIKETLTGTNSNYVIWRIIVDLLYLVPIDEKHLQKINLSDLGKFCEQLKLTELVYFAATLRSTSNQKEKQKLKNQFQTATNNQTKLKLSNFLRSHIISQKIVKQNSEDLLPSEKLQLITPSKSDVIIRIDPEYKTSSETSYYPSHRCILSRSDYYNTLFETSSNPDFQFTDEISIFSTDPDLYNSNSNTVKLLHFNLKPELIPIIQLPIDFHIYSSSYEMIVEQLLSFLYHDEVRITDDALAIDLILLSDSLLIDRLKTMASVALTQISLTSISIYDVLTTGWLARLPRLEHHAAYVISQDLKNFIQEDEFKEVVIESSKRVQNRESFDSIELIDDIRFYLSKKYHIDANEDEILNPMFVEGTIDKTEEVDDGVIEYNKQLDLIDTLLKELGLNA